MIKVVSIVTVTREPTAADPRPGGGNGHQVDSAFGGSAVTAFCFDERVPIRSGNQRVHLIAAPLGKAMSPGSRHTNRWLLSGGWPGKQSPALLEAF